MELLDGGGRALSLRRFPPIPRIRPGESPAWIELPLSGAQVKTWRTRAHDAGLGVDAWLGVLIEYALAARALDDLSPGLAADVVAEAQSAERPSALPPTAALRDWRRALTTRTGPEPAADELPSVVLPERLIAQLPPSGLASAIAAAVAPVEARALACELAATAVGLTMEAWMFRRGAARLAAASS